MTISKNLFFSLVASSFMATSGAYAQGVGVIAEPGYPEPGATHQGESGFGNWTSNQLRGVLETLPYGSPTQAHVGLRVWEFFKPGAFYDLAPQYQGVGASVTALLDQYNPDAVASVTAPVFNGEAGRLTDSLLQFRIGGSAAEAITSISITIKHSPYMAFLDDPINPSMDLYTPFSDMVLVLNEGPDELEFLPGISFDYNNRYVTSESGTSVSFVISEFRWDLELGAGEEFAFYFSNPAAYFSVDAIAIHTLGVQPIPEPGTYALLGAGALLLARWRGRRSRH